MNSTRPAQPPRLFVFTVKQVTLDLVPRKINAFSTYRGKFIIKFLRIYSEIIAIGHRKIRALTATDIKVSLYLSAHDSGQIKACFIIAV